LKKIDLGQGISILANIGVIAGIIFLGLELQQNNELLKAEAADGLLQNRLSPRRQILEHRDLAQLMTKHASGKPLTDADELLTKLYIENVFLTWEWSFHEYSEGRIEGQGTAGHRRAFHGHSGIPNSWYLATWNEFKTVLNPDFVRYTEEEIIGQTE
jgi:hypothetical protein